MFSEVYSEEGTHEKTNRVNVAKYSELAESNIKDTNPLDGWVLSTPQRSFIESLLDNND